MRILPRKKSKVNERVITADAWDALVEQEVLRMTHATRLKLCRMFLLRDKSKINTFPVNLRCVVRDLWADMPRPIKKGGRPATRRPEPR